MFPPIQCSKSSFFTQWLISEYLNRINDTSTTADQLNHEQHQPPPPPKSPATPNSNHNNHHVFTAKHFKQLFSTHSSGNLKSSASSPSQLNHHHQNNHSHHNQSNNNDYNKTGVADSSSSTATNRNIEIIQLLALNALEFTAPIYSFINKSVPNATANHQSSSSQQSSSSPLPKQQPQQPPPSSTKCRCPSTRSFVQLSGHPGSFAPAGPNTVWKKMPEEEVATSSSKCVGGSCSKEVCLRELLEKLANRDHQSSSSSPSPSSFPTIYTENTTTTPITVFFNSSPSSPSSSSDEQQPTSTASPQQQNSSNLLPPQIHQIPTSLIPNETRIYRSISSLQPPDPITQIIPKYVTETIYNSQMFLELEDLLTNFSTHNPTIMDLKLGTRTFLESEVANTKPRPDLYKKLCSVDGSACTEAEHEAGAVTKLTYMLFRERQSSSCSLGFRVEGVNLGDFDGDGGNEDASLLDTNYFKTLRDERLIKDVFKRFCKCEVALVESVISRLEFVRETMEKSEFFMSHEVIGASLLFIHDNDRVGVWLIDFAKTFGVLDGDAKATQRLTHRANWVMGNREDGVLTGVDNILRLFKGVYCDLVGKKT